MYNTSINLSDVIRGKKNLFMYLNKRIKVCEVASDVVFFYMTLISNFTKSYKLLFYHHLVNIRNYR